MSDKKRQIRGQFTAGVQDLHDFYEDLKQVAAARGFEPTFYDLKPFGDVGPIHKLSFGFTQT
jgi:hypothetical protein